MGPLALLESLPPLTMVPHSKRRDHANWQVTLVATPEAVLLKNDPEAVGLDVDKDCGIRTEMRLHACAQAPPATPLAPPLGAV